MITSCFAGLGWLACVSADRLGGPGWDATYSALLTRILPSNRVARACSPGAKREANSSHMPFQSLHSVIIPWAAASLTAEPGPKWASTMKPGGKGRQFTEGVELRTPELLLLQVVCSSTVLPISDKNFCYTYIR